MGFQEASIPPYPVYPFVLTDRTKVEPIDESWGGLVVPATVLNHSIEPEAADRTFHLFVALPCLRVRLPADYVVLISRCYRVTPFIQSYAIRCHGNLGGPSQCRPCVRPSIEVFSRAEDGGSN